MKKLIYFLLLFWLMTGTAQATLLPTITANGTSSAVVTSSTALSGPYSSTVSNGSSNASVGISLTTKADVTVAGLTPARNALNVPAATDVSVTFSEPVINDASTLGAINVFSHQRGGKMRNGVRGVTTLNGNTLSFNPATDFKPGETVFTTLTSPVQGSSGNSLTRGHVHQFTVQAGGAGRGFFQPGGDYQPGYAPWGVATGDIDGDGDLDILSASRDGALIVMRNNGLGVFKQEPIIPFEISVSAVKLGDLDADGDLDFVAAAESNYVIVALNDGSGTFSQTSQVPVQSNNYSIELGDVDADGDLDIFVSNLNGGSVSIRLNNGTGAFSGGSNVSVATRPGGIAIGDVDGDGDIDLLSAAAESFRISVRLNDGGGFFSASQDIVVSNDPEYLVLGDIDGDGDLDLLSNNVYSHTYSIYRNDGHGVFALDRHLSGINYPRGFALVDVDADGDLDLLGVYSNNSGFNEMIGLWLNDGTGAFTLTRSISGGCPYAIATGDLDGDGDVDYVTTSATGCYSINIRFNQAQNPTITVVNPSSHTTTVGAYYSQPFYGLGGASPYSFSVVSSNLPSSLSLSTSGVLSGIPTETGSYSLIVQARDANGVVGIGTVYSLTVIPSDCGTTIYVTQDGSGLRDGSSWSNAFSGTALQTAINRAAGCGAQVWVAQGLYKPTTSNDRTISFAMKEGVAIYGGFLGSETALSGRPPINPVTGQPSSSTLSGEIGTSLGAGYESDNSYHLFLNTSLLTNRAILDGFVLTQGSASYQAVDPYPSRGGAIVNDGNGESSAPVIRNCLFISNFASEGGAIFSRNSSPIIDNCRFENNSESYRGGALSFSRTSSPLVMNSTFLVNNNPDGVGGVIYTDGPVNLTALNTTFRNNLASVGGVIYTSGSGRAQLTLTDCVFESNTAAYGGALVTQTTTDIILTRCQFLSNTAWYAESGAMYAAFGPLTATDCVFKNNSSIDHSGAIYSSGDGTKLTNCLFQNNSTQGYGGALSLGYSTTLTNCVFQSNTANQGGAIAYGNPMLINCSFLSNQANEGGAIYYGYEIQLINSILWNNGAGNSITGTEEVSASYSLFDTGVTGYVDGGHNLTATTSPFVSNTSAQLASCSPAINTGSNQAYNSANGPGTDVAGNARIFNNGVIDRGAYEFQGGGQPASFTVLGGGTITCGSSPTVSLNGSETDISYQLLRDGISVGSSLTGTGAALSFGPQSLSGVYTVVATALNSTCTAVMTSSATVVGSANSPSLTLTPSSATLTCSSPSITLVATPGSTSYAFSSGQSGSSNTLVVSSAGLYSVTATGANGCTAVASAVISGTVLQNATVTTDGPVGCGRTSAQITIQAEGATSFTLVGPDGFSAVNGTGVFSVTAGGSYTGVAGQPGGCVVSGVVVVGSGGIQPSASDFRASGPIGPGSCAVRLLGTVTGNTFVMTGPGGYVFSNTYRTAGTYALDGRDVRLPGTYTLTVYSGSCSATYTTVVTGTACASGQ